MKTYNFKAKKNYDKIKYFLLDIGLSFALIKSISRYIGQIERNGQGVRTNDKINKNDILVIHYEETERNEIIKTKNKLNIAYEDDYYLIVNKDFGTATIPSYCNYTNTLANYTTEYLCQKDKNFVFRAFNRLDKETSGFVIICKDLISYNLLQKYNQKLIKKYEVITQGKLIKQTISKPIQTISNGEKNEIKRVIDSNGKTAITHILKAKYNKMTNKSYAIIQLETGRTHQIRLHLSSINNPIIGDTLYSTTKSDRMYLNCFYLKIFHPILKKTIVLNQPIFKEKIKLF